MKPLPPDVLTLTLSFQQRKYVLQNNNFLVLLQSAACSTRTINIVQVSHIKRDNYNRIKVAMLDLRFVVEGIGIPVFGGIGLLGNKVLG